MGCECKFNGGLLAQRIARDRERVGSVTYKASANTTRKQRQGGITVYLTGSGSQQSVFTLTEQK